MRRRQIWAARAAADLAAGTYAAIAPETPLDAVGVFTSAVPREKWTAISEPTNIPPPKRRGRPPRVKRDG